MKIKMRVHFAGNGFVHAPGDEVERPDDEAIRLIKKGYAAPLSAMPMERAVVVPAVETRPAVEPAPAPAAHAEAPAPHRHKGKGRKAR